MLRHFKGSLVVAVLASCLLSCTPSHTLEKTEHYARSLGVINGVDIKRWHNRIIPADSRIIVVVNPIEGVDSDQLSSAISTALAPYFTTVISAGSTQSKAMARKVAGAYRSGFILYVEAGAGGSSQRQQQSKGDAQQKPPQYSQLQLLLSLVDVVSGKTIDRVSLTARSPLFGMMADDLQSLLAVPIAKVGEDLTGLR